MGLAIEPACPRSPTVTLGARPADLDRVPGTVIGDVEDCGKGSVYSPSMTVRVRVVIRRRVVARSTDPSAVNCSRLVMATAKQRG